MISSQHIFSFVDLVFSLSVIGMISRDLVFLSSECCKGTDFAKGRYWSNNKKMQMK